MFRCLLWVFAVCFFVASVSCENKQNTKKLIPIEDFFVKPEKSNFKISPDGRRIAYLGIDDHCRNIFVLDLQNKRKSKQLTYQSDMNVQYFFWASDSLIIYSNSHSPQDSLRIYSILVDTEKTTPLLPVKKARLRWLAPHTLYGDYLLATLNDRDSTVFELYKIFVDGTAPELLTRNPGNISRWFSSPDGKVRLAMTNDSVQESILYRAEEDMPFRQVTTTDYQTSIRPLGFVRDSDTLIYALSNHNRDRLSLVEYIVSTGEEERLVFGNSEVDLEPVGYAEHLQELIYSQYTINKVKRHFFHSTVQQYFEKLSAKFNNRSIDIIDTDTSMVHWLVKVYTDVDAGGIYHYDVQRDTAELLEEMNPKLAAVSLSPKEPVGFQSRDGLTLHGYLTYPLTGKREGLP